MDVVADEEDADALGLQLTDEVTNLGGLGRTQDPGQNRRVAERPLEQHRQRPDVVGAEDDVDPRRPPGDLGPVLLCEAAADRDLHAGVRVLHRAQVAEVARPHRVPIIGQGGIATAEDAIEFMIAGATTVWARRIPQRPGFV